MAFGASTIWEIEPGTGSDTANGGGFDPGATMASDLAATSATGAAPVATSASYNFVASDVGAYVFIKSGTNWYPGWYKIASVASNAATLTATVGSVVSYTNTQPGNYTTTLGCASTASPTGGTWSVDYSRGGSGGAGSPRIAYNDMVILATTTQFTSAGNPVGPNIVGNLIAVTSGTGFTVQWVEVLSTSGTTATCDKSLGTTASTGGNGGLGGALATIGKAGALHIGSNVVFLLGNTTSTCTNSSNVAGGKFSITNGAAGTSTILVGYLTSRTLTNTDGSRPVVQPLAATNNVTCILMGSACTVRNIDCENANSCTGCVAVDTGDQLYTVVENCKMSGYKTGIRVASSSNAFIALNCEIVLSNESGSLGFDTPGGGIIRGCYIHGGTGSSSNGISAANFLSVVDTVIANITGTASVGISCGTANRIDGVTIYNVPIGISCVSAQGHLFRNVYCEDCVTDGIVFNGAKDSVRLLNCAGFNNGANYDVAFATPLNVLGFIACGASAVTAPGSGDFTLNTAATGGQLLRGLGWPATIAGLSQASHPDVGAYQHADPPAGGLSGQIMRVSGQTVAIY